METATLLNINAKAQKASDSLIGKASAIDLFADKKADKFGSAFRKQLNKHPEEKSHPVKEKDKNLPHSGKDLPDKKIAKDNNDNAPVTQIKDEQRNGVRDEQKHDIEKQALNEQSSDVEIQSGNKSGTDQEPAVKTQENYTGLQQNESQQETIQAIDEIIDSVVDKDDGGHEKIYAQQPGEPSTEIDDLTAQKTEPLNQDYSSLVAPISNETIPTEVALGSEEERLMAAEIRAKETHPGGFNGTAVTETAIASSDLKAHSEPVSYKKELFQSLPSERSSQDMVTRNGIEQKNTNALATSVTDFQNYIEMSKKHSSSNEPIASIGFQANLKAEALKGQMLFNETKLPPGHNITPAQLSIQALSSERSSSVNGVSTSMLQNLPSLEVKTSVGKPGWNQGFSQQIVMMATNGIHQAKIRLNPMHLGPVEALVKLSGESAIVNLSSLHLTTKEAMDSAIPRLKEMLNENGFSQVDVNVSHQDKKSQQEANLSSNQERSNSEHGNSTMPGEEQLSEVNSESDPQAQIEGVSGQGLHIVNCYA